MDMPPQQIIGSAGLTGRPRIDRIPVLEQPIEYDEEGNPVYAREPAPSKAIPPNCLRKLVSPLNADALSTACNGCPGLQADGTCLSDLVKDCQQRGLDWSFTVRLDDYGNQIWTYAGEVEKAAPEQPSQNDVSGYPV